MTSCEMSLYTFFPKKSKLRFYRDRSTSSRDVSEVLFVIIRTFSSIILDKPTCHLDVSSFDENMTSFIFEAKF